MPPSASESVDVIIEVLRQLPLLSGVTWFGLAAFQVYRDRWHTWSESFFLFATIFAAAYAVADWFLFNVQSLYPPDAVAGGAQVSAVAGLICLALAELFFLLFSFVYVDRMRKVYLVFVAGAIGLLAVLATTTVTGVLAPAQAGGLYLPLFNPVGLWLYLIYVLGYGVTGVWNLVRVYRIVRRQSAAVARKAAGLTVAFTLVLVLGFLTNGYLDAVQNTTVPPPFSSLLLVVVLVAAYTLYPGSRERVSTAIRHFMSRRYDIRAAFLTFQDGTLIASKAKPGEAGAGVDQDLFSATLDVIQNFMRTSFPILRGTSLRTIEHGDYRILIERGKRCYLTLVIEGEENDQLRRQMRDALLEFEATNAEALRTWRGVPSEARGVDALLNSVFEPASLFTR